MQPTFTRAEIALLLLALALAIAWPLAWMGFGLPYSRGTFVALLLPAVLLARRIGRGAAGEGAGRDALARLAPAPSPSIGRGVRDTDASTTEGETP